MYPSFSFISYWPRFNTSQIWLQSRLGNVVFTWVASTYVNKKSISILKTEQILEANLEHIKYSRITSNSPEYFSHYKWVFLKEIERYSPTQGKKKFGKRQMNPLYDFRKEVNETIFSTFYPSSRPYSPTLSDY